MPAPIATRSAAMLSALAMISSPRRTEISDLEVRPNRTTISSPSPLPLARAVRSQISWTPAISGKVKRATHNIEKPNLAPVCA